MVTWRRYVRYGLAALVFSLCAAILFSLRDRADSTKAVIVDRADPEAIVQTRGSLVLQADAFGENLSVAADRQLTYPDGTMRMINGVTITAADREDRPGFVLTSNEVLLGGDQANFELSGSVKLISEDGLEATSEFASYSDSEGVIQMLGEAVFNRDGMSAKSYGAEYERSGDILRLLNSSQVEIKTSDSETKIASQQATIAQSNGFMEFKGLVEIEAGAMRMTADQARVLFLAGSSTEIEQLELLGSAEVFGKREVSGELEEMSADMLTLTYDESGYLIEQALLEGSAMLKLYGQGEEGGLQIGGDLINVELSPSNETVRSLSAREETFFRLPSTSQSPAQSIQSSTLLVSSESGNGLDRAIFQGAVQYLESQQGEGEQFDRSARSDNLEVSLTKSMSVLESALFSGNVTFEDGSVLGEADLVLYSLSSSALELTADLVNKQTPRVLDRRGSVQAEVIRVELDGPKIFAEGNVESVLGNNEAERQNPSGQLVENNAVNRPKLLNSENSIFVTADQMSYDSTTEVARYLGSAHLWQEQVEFYGDEITLDESVGSIYVQGNVRTKTELRQINSDTGVQEETIMTGGGGQMSYDNVLRQVIYTEGAQVVGPRGDMQGESIRVHLQEDARTLDRIEASGSVRLETTKRIVSGETLLYRDSDGRYEMYGEPVRIIEEIESECRETIGRSLTFFIMGDELSVDGQAETRTQTASGECLELKQE